jgi:hypothetical protein
MHIILFLCALVLVLLLFSVAESVLLEALGVSTQYSRVLHAFITAYFVVENWCLHLCELQSVQKGSGQDELIAQLVAQNSRLERRCMQMKSYGKSHSFHVVPSPVEGDRRCSRSESG